MAKKAFNPLEQDAEGLEAHVEQLSRKFDRLKGMYENFFVGVDKQAPSVPRREMNRLILETQQLSIAKATTRFKFQTLLQKWVTYIAYWNRTIREIENGTYRRDVAKAQRMLTKEGAAMTTEQAIALGVPAARVRAFIDKQNKLTNMRRGSPESPGGPEQSAPPANVARPIPGMSEGDLKDFYQRYQQARQSVGDQRPLRSLPELSEKLRPQIERVLAENKAHRATIEVVVEDGQVRVRARPVQ